MAYVVVVERAMDVRLVVRLGVQYLLARGTIRLIQIAGSIAVFFAAVAFFPRSPALTGSQPGAIRPGRHRRGGHCRDRPVQRSPAALGRSSLLSRGLQR